MFLESLTTAFPSFSYMSDHGSPPPGGAEPSPPPGDDAPDGLITPGLGAGLQTLFYRVRADPYSLGLGLRA